MGIRDWFARRRAEYRETDYYYRLGCEVLGPQPNYTSVIERSARIAEGKREHARRQARQGHKGGWGEVTHGFIGRQKVTFALGWGTKEGETLLADGHLDPRVFLQSGNHNHYGKGQGPNLNVKDRGRYTGPGA